MLFERVLARVLARLPDRIAARTRPLPPLLQAVQPRFSACYALDGTILEALFRKLQTLRDVAFTFFDDLTAAGSWFVTRLREKTSFSVQQILVNRTHVRDRIIKLAYVWVGRQNGVQLQVWATWLYYAVLIDLCAATTRGAYDCDAMHCCQCQCRYFR